MLWNQDTAVKQMFWISKWILGLINSLLGFVIYKSWNLGKNPSNSQLWGSLSLHTSGWRLPCEDSSANQSVICSPKTREHRQHRDAAAGRGHPGTSGGFQTRPDHWLMPLQSPEAQDTTCLCNSSLMHPVTTATRVVTVSWEARATWKQDSQI